MKRRVLCIVKKVAMLVLAAMIIVCASNVSAQARPLAIEEMYATDLIIKARDMGLIEARTVFEFKPSKEATVGFTAKLLYRASILKKGYGEDSDLMIITKQSVKWLESQALNAVTKQPEYSQAMKADFANLKKGAKVSYHFVGLAATLVRFGDCRYSDEEWQEGLQNLALKVREQWAFYRKGERMTRLEVLQVVVDLLFPHLPQGYDLVPEAEALKMGTPCAPPTEEKAILGTALRIDEEGYIYEDDRLIGLYKSVSETKVVEGEGIACIEPPAQEVELLAPPICIVDGVTYTGEPVLDVGPAICIIDGVTYTSP